MTVCGVMAPKFHKFLFQEYLTRFQNKKNKLTIVAKQSQHDFFFQTLVKYSCLMSSNSDFNNLISIFGEEIPLTLFHQKKFCYKNKYMTRFEKYSVCYLDPIFYIT